MIRGIFSRRRAAQAAARRGAYCAGVLNAGHALMCDLENLGVLDDAEIVDSGQDGTRTVCSTCQMRRMGYEVLATRVEFAIDVTRDGGFR